MEVEKLSQTIHDLEEVILANGTTANIVRDYQRQISELQVGISYRLVVYADLLVDDLCGNLVLHNSSGGEKDTGEGASKSKSFSQ